MGISPQIHEWAGFTRPTTANAGVLLKLSSSMSEYYNDVYAKGMTVYKEPAIFPL